MESTALFWFVTACSFSIAFTPTFVKFILRFLYPVSRSERELRDQILALKQEQLCVNIVDEFAKHAKIERKIIAAANSLKTQNSSRTRTRLIAKYGTSALLYLFNSLLVVYLVWQYGRQPVIAIQPAWIYPLDRFIVTQSAHLVGISMTFWLLLSSTVAKIIQRSI